MSTKVVVLRAQPEALKAIKETPKKPRRRPAKRQTTAEAEDTAKAAVRSVPSTGAVVARALDRSGLPCRRWTKSPLKIRSFTGVPFSVSVWQGAADPNANPDGDETKPADGGAEIKQEGALPELPTDISELQSEPMSELVSEPPSEAPPDLA